MNEKNVYTKLSSLLDAHPQPLAMLAHRGPLRAVAELVRDIVFTSSPQLSNAGRLLADSSRPLRRAVDRLSGYLFDRKWNHGECSVRRWVWLRGWATNRCRCSKRSAMRCWARLTRAARRR